MQKDSLELRLRLLSDQQLNIYKLLTAPDEETVILGLAYLPILLEAQPGQEVCKEIYFNIRTFKLKPRDKMPFMEYLKKNFGKHVINQFIMTYTSNKMKTDEENFLHW